MDLRGRYVASVRNGVCQSSEITILRIFFGLLHELNRRVQGSKTLLLYIYIFFLGLKTLKPTREKWYVIPCIKSFPSLPEWTVIWEMPKRAFQNFEGLTVVAKGKVHLWRTSTLLFNKRLRKRSHFSNFVPRYFGILLDPPSNLQVLHWPSPTLLKGVRSGIFLAGNFSLSK